jgi:hypothetical protein
LLGLLVLIGFFTQLTIDLIFSFFSDKFNIPLSVKLTPVLTFIGLVVYAIFPYLFADHVYLGLVIGTVSVAEGFSTSMGAMGVGKATQRSVIASFLLILMLGYMITRVCYR